MADVDYSSPQHRLDNYANHKFVKLYAEVRHFVFDDNPEFDLKYYLRGYMAAAEEAMADQLGIPQTSLVGMLVDLGVPVWDSTDGQDQAATPTA